MSDNSKGGRPAIGEPINVRFGPENLAWIDREAAVRHTTRADMLRGVVTAAREAAHKPVRTEPANARFAVTRLGQHSPGSIERFEELSALWSAHMRASTDYLKQAAQIESDADDATDNEGDPFPAEVTAQITALQGAARACALAAAEQEEDIASLLAQIEQDAREAGIDVNPILYDA